MDTTVKEEKRAKDRNDEFAYSIAMVLAVLGAVVGNVTSPGETVILIVTVLLLVIMTTIAIRQLAVIRGLRADVAARDESIVAKDAMIVRLRDRELILRSQAGIGERAVKELFGAGAAICHDRTDVGARKARDEAALNALRLGIRIAHKDRELSPSMTSIWAWAPSDLRDLEQVAMFADLLAHRKGDVKEVLEQENAPDDIARHFLGLETQQQS